MKAGDMVWYLLNEKRTRFFIVEDGKIVEITDDVTRNGEDKGSAHSLICELSRRIFGRSSALKPCEL